ncbi:hypothetical protein [Nocardia crassostreae]|uniref:hypothetical protein n=1 Tax=Nocardia crassostreae TaxID=53428 RepID=UPI000ACA93D7|nr:hypothetical protein [Nocardia crassostreae]
MSRAQQNSTFRIPRVPVGVRALLVAVALIGWVVFLGWAAGVAESGPPVWC